MRRVAATPWHHHPGHREVVVPRRIDPTGRHGPTANAARGGRWRRLGGGWFVPASVDVDSTEPPAQRIVLAAVHLPEYGGVTGWAALHWMGARWFDGVSRGGTPYPVVLAVGPGNLRATGGWHPSKERLRPEDLTVVDGLRVTTAVRSVLFEMRYAAGVRAAVEVADLAVASDLVSLDELRHHADDQLQGWTGVPQVREAIELAVESCWSPPECRMRLVWELDAGLPRPLANRPVFGLDGRHLFTPDLLDPVSGVVGEYDGAQFHSGARRAVDLDRDETYRRYGLEPVTMVAGDLGGPGGFLTRLQSAHQRGLARGEGPRRWTIDPPPWWASA